MKTIRNLLFVLVSVTLTLSFTANAQELQTYDDGLDFKQENLDNFNKNTELKSSSLSLSSTSYGNSGGGNTSLGPYLIVGGLVFGTIGALGGTLGADYEGGTNNPKPFYRQGAHFLTALSGGVIFTTGIILTLNNR